MPVPTTYASWGRLGGQSFTRQPPTLPQGVFVTLDPVAPSVTKRQPPAYVAPTEPAALIAVEDPVTVPEVEADDPAAVTEVYASEVAGQGSPLMRALPWGVGLLLLGGGAYALTKRKR